MQMGKRMVLLMLVDIVLINFSLLFALWLRFDGDVPSRYMVAYTDLALFFTVICLVCFYVFRLYNRLWKYASLGELLSIVYAVTFSTILCISLTYFWAEGGGSSLPRSVFVLWWMTLILFLGGSRVSWRLFRDTYLVNGKTKAGKPALIVGAGDAGAGVAKEMKKNNVNHNMPVGYVDDDPAKNGLEMFGLKVLGTTEDIPRLVEDYGIQEVIIAIPSASKKSIRQVVEICQKTSAQLKILPGIYELIDGSVTINDIREIQVEDILGREPVDVDLESMSGYLKDRAVLVTGAGGSIGSELCRQVAQFDPRFLILMGHGENSIYEIHKELTGNFPELDVRPVICDMKDENGVYHLFREYRPQVVFHAAAYKHVPLMEFNPVEALKNNILGTYNVASAASKFKVETFTLVSTDKAINPTSIMGATKRVSEMVVEQIGLRSSKTKYAAVRFGNVLGSRGSVVLLFKEQIAKGGPVTVTDPEMVRYFMTIPEAVQLVIQSGSLTRGNDVFVLDMGEPVKILDLARNMIRLSGFIPGEDIEIVYTGMRPGEKLYEEMLTASEGVNATIHDRIYMAEVDRPDKARLNNLLNTLLENDAALERKDVVKLLEGVVPEFQHQDVSEGEQVGYRPDKVEKKTPRVAVAK